MLSLEKEVDKFGWMRSVVEVVRNLLQSVHSMDLEDTIVVMGKMLELDVTIRNFDMQNFRYP